MLERKYESGLGPLLEPPLSFDSSEYHLRSVPGLEAAERKLSSFLSSTVIVRGSSSTSCSFTYCIARLVRSATCSSNRRVMILDSILSSREPSRNVHSKYRFEVELF